MLEEVYDHVDYLAPHQYYGADELDEQSLAACGADFDSYISAAIATCDYVKEVRRPNRRLNLAVDEWAVCYNTPEFYERQRWEFAPAIGEYEYQYRDAVVVGSLLISLLRHADRVKVACQSLLVNTTAPNDGNWGWGLETDHICALVGHVRCSQRLSGMSGGD